MSGESASRQDRGFTALAHTSKTIANDRNGEICPAIIRIRRTRDEAAILIALAHQPEARSERRAAVRADGLRGTLGFQGFR